MLLALLLACGGADKADDTGAPDDSSTDSGDTGAGGDSGDTDSGDTDSGDTDSGDTDSGDTDSGDDTSVDSGDTDSGDTGETGGDTGCEDPGTYYSDADGDGHGAPGTGAKGCGGPGWAETDDDCDDTDGTVWPGAPELCDGHDNNCDGAWSSADEEGRVTFLPARGPSEDRSAEWAGTASSLAHPTLDAGTWLVCPGTYYVSATTTGPVAIQGAGRDLTVLSGGGIERVLASVDTLSLRGVTLTEGAAAWPGGALSHSAGALTIEETTVSASVSESYGGGLHVATSDGTDVSLRDVTVTGNAGTTGGGALIAVAGDVALVDCDFDHNTADLGGGLSIDAASAMVLTSAFRENAATSTGGGLLIESGTMGDVWLQDATIENNTAGADGGGAFVMVTTYAGDSVFLTATTIRGNTAGDDGGGARLVGDVVLVTDSLVEGNSAFTSGGLHLGGYSLEVSTTTFSTNVASQEGGGLYTTALDGATVDTVTFRANEAAYGAGLYVSGASASTPALVTGATFDGNNGWWGGGMYLYSGELTVEASTYTANSAAFDGGAIATEGCDLLRIDPSTTAVGNIAGDYGGALYADCSVECVGYASGPTAFHANEAGLGGAIFFDPYRSETLTVNRCDFGEGADDNVAEYGIDLYVVDVGEFSYGDAVTFTCTDSECR